MESAKDAINEILEMPFVRAAVLSVLLFAASGLGSWISAILFGVHRRWRIKQASRAEKGQTTAPQVALAVAAVLGVLSLTGFALTLFFALKAVGTFALPEFLKKNI